MSIYDVREYDKIYDVNLPYSYGDNDAIVRAHSPDDEVDLLVTIYSSIILRGRR